MTKQINIHNIRKGFANNSSSTHSVLLLPPGIDMSNIETTSTSNFGWDTFTVVGDDIKNYLRATLNSNFPYKLHDDYKSAILNEWCGKRDEACELGDEYVDHQSCISLPVLFNREGIDKQFFEEVKTFFMQPNLVIVGGNDNEDTVHSLEIQYNKYTHSMSSLFRTDGGSFISKYDIQYKYWTLFNEYTGNKTRISFTETGTITPNVNRASTPDLCDIKLTDFCATGCRYCYQGSTTQGKHADTSEINNIIRTLSDAEVFEIAFGGGEPTTHPDFIDILKYTREHNIVPNFTTRNLQWIKDNIEEIRDVFGSFAYSVDDAHRIKQLATIRDYHDIPYYKMAIQYVPGVNSAEWLKSILRKCYEHGMPITLLGYKTNNRGAKVKPHEFDWLKIITDLRDQENIYLNVGIDTALIQQSEHLLKEHGIPNWMYHKDEGVFSWYVDAVDKKQGPSSYHEVKEYKNFYSEFYEEYDAYEPKN
jgi:organic radical activating enzyme